MGTSYRRIGGDDSVARPVQRELTNELRRKQSAMETDAAPLVGERAPARAASLAPYAGSIARGRTRFPAGTTVNHYEIIRPLGQGGMGEVYLARDTRLGRRVALKFLLTVDSQLSARFTVEARATAQLTHENIVALYDVGEHDGLPYMVLEYVPGKTLAAWLKERREDGGLGRSTGVPAARAAELMLPVARALQCAHEAGIVHRDLKPANIMLGENGTVKVVDFGIAKLLGDASGRAHDDDAPRSRASMPMPTPVALTPDDDTQGALAHADALAALTQIDAMAALTQADAVVGTHAYMAPEQWGSEPVDGRTDLWAIGVMLYLMVTGEHPLAPLSPEALVSVALRDEPMPSVRARLPGIGRLGAVIDRCLLKHAADRLGSARELREELEAIARPHVSAPRGGDEEANPYAGLAAFQEQDAPRFFGRETMVEQIVARLGEQPLLALVGSSGSGKSSLVRAGVIPALKRGGDAWEAFVLRPGPRPLTALIELLLQHSWSNSSQTTGTAPSNRADPLLSLGDRDVVRERLGQEPGFFGVQLRARARRRLERVLLFVDQFEEVYTLAQEGEREAFLACLAGAADDASSPLRVVVSIRHDFLDRVASSTSALSELVSRGTVLVSPLDRRGLKSALIEPAEALGHRFESEMLSTEMLDALAGAASALPLLQFTAAKLWEGRDRERRLLTEASYRAFGGVGGALASHADSVLGGLSSTERRCARALLLRLVTPERTRAIVTRRELSELGGVATEAPRVLDRLIEARLVTVEGAGSEESTVELVHESLIDTWPALARWLEGEQDDAQFRARLRGAAKEWEASGSAEGLLWRGEAAIEARRWQKRQGGEAGADLRGQEARYLDAVVALLDRQLRTRRQIVGAVIAALSVIVLLVSTLAIRWQRAAERAEVQKTEANRQRAEAELQRAEAERSAALARNATRVAVARERQGDPTTVLALLREIEPGSTPRGWAELTRGAQEAGVAPVVLLHDAAVRFAVWSPDGKRIVSASADKTVRVWRADGAGQPLNLEGHEADVRSAFFSPDGQHIVSASEDKTVRVWKADGTGQPLVLRGHEGAVYSAVFSADGQHIVSASEDKTVRVWKADGSGQPLVLRGHDAAVWFASISPDGQRIVSASADKTVRVWRADGTGQALVLQGHDAGVRAAVFSPDGQRIASVSEDRMVRVWSTDGSGQPLVLQGHDTAVYSAAWSPDGQRIVSASADKTVRVWRADGTGQPLVLRGHDASVMSAAFSPDGHRIVSASADKTARVWKVDGSGHPLVLRGHDDGVYGVAFSPDGRRIVSASADKTVRVWKTDSATPPLVLQGHDAIVYSAAFSPDGQRIASASEDKTVRVWKADGTGQPLVLRGHEAAVWSAAWSPDGQRIASASWDMTVRVWNADGSGQPLVLRGHEAGIYGAAWSPDGLRIVSASWDKTVRVWSADGTGQPLVLQGQEPVYSAAFSPDGQRIVSASGDKTVRVWRADGTGQPLVLRGHEASVGVRGDRPFSPDGSRIVSSSDDATVRLWNADGSGEPLVLRASTQAVNAASWSPDGQRIVAGSDDKTVIVWSDLEQLHGADDPKLWTATTYCMPLEVRQRLLGFLEAQSKADLARCQQRVREAQSRAAAPR